MNRNSLDRFFKDQIREIKNVNPSVFLLSRGWILTILVACFLFGMLELLIFSQSEETEIIAENVSCTINVIYNDKGKDPQARMVCPAYSSEETFGFGEHTNDIVLMALVLKQEEGVNYQPTCDIHRGLILGHISPDCDYNEVVFGSDEG